MYTFLSTVAFILLGCVGIKQQTTLYVPIDHDLTKYRVVFGDVPFPSNADLVVTNSSDILLTPKSCINEAINAKVAIMKQTNAQVKTTPGFKIQLYLGNSRTEATIIAEEIRLTLAEKTRLSYVQPNYIVKLGNYLTSFEAYSVLAKVKNNYPQAIVVKEAIELAQLSMAVEEKDMGE